MATPPTGYPQAFGKYRLHRKIARGGMAELFLASEGDTRRPVVIKRVLPHFTQDTEFLKMFLNEARIAAQLNHPGIVRVFDLGKEAEHLYIAMEFVDGFDLETLTKLSGGRLPPAIAARVGADVCEALYYANRMSDLEGKPLNIVHRDVTPGNVMVTRRGGVKLVDFGVAKAAAQLERTRPGVVKGKFRYMSPEQISFKELDGRSDLFSLGTMLYEVTTGERPFERKQIVDIIRALTEWHPPPPAEVVKGYPKALSAVIMQALQKDRDTRYRSAREMQAALEQALAKTPTGRAELATFLADLAKKHPKELAPAAPEFEPIEDEPQFSPTSPGQDTARMSASQEAESIDGNAELRTEAIPGKEMKRMLAEADRRAASRGAPVAKAPEKPLGRQSSRLPFQVGPPEEVEATKLALDDEAGEEETTTTTEPAGIRLRPSTAPARPSAQRLAQPRDPPLVKPPPPVRTPAGDDGPDTRPLPVRQQVSKPPPPVRRSQSVPVPAPMPGLEAAELGQDDDLDVPTVSNAVAPRPNGRRRSAPEVPSVVSELSVGKVQKASNRRFLIVVLAVVVLALIVLGWVFTAGSRPVELPEQLRDGVDLGKQPVDPADSDPNGEQPTKADPPPSERKAEPPAAEGEGETLLVEGPIGTRVAIGDRGLMEVPFTLGDLKPGRYRCTYIPVRGNAKKKCREVVIEAGRSAQITVK